MLQHKVNARLISMQGVPDSAENCPWSTFFVTNHTTNGEYGISEDLIDGLSAPRTHYISKKVSLMAHEYASGYLLSG